MPFSITKTLETGVEVTYWEKTNFFTDLQNQLLIVEMSGWINSQVRLSTGIDGRASVIRVVISGQLFGGLASELLADPHPKSPILDIIDSYVIKTEEFSGATII